MRNVLIERGACFLVKQAATERFDSDAHPETSSPVILHARDYDRWLDREETERLPTDLLRPFDSEAMEMHEANSEVNNARNDRPELLRQATRTAESGALPL